MHPALIDRAHPGHPCGGDVQPGLTSDTTMRASAFNHAWEFPLGPFIVDGVQGWVMNGTDSLALGNSIVLNGSLDSESPSSRHENVKDRSPSTPYTKARNTSSERDWNLTGHGTTGARSPQDLHRRQNVGLLPAPSIPPIVSVGRVPPRHRGSQDLLVPKQHSAREWGGLYEGSQPWAKPRADYPC